MGYTHRDNAQFSRSRWRKRILLPCWIAQIGLLLATMGLFSYRLSHTVKTWKDEEDLGNIPMVEFVWEAVNVAFSFVSLVITFVSIAKFIAEVLTPLPLLFSNILNLVFASAVLALDIVVYLKHTEKQYSLIGLAMDCTLMFFTIIPAIYSFIIYRRLLSYDDYHIPGNVKPYGYASEPEDTYRSSWLEPPTPYDPTNPGGVTRPRAVSAASRRLSLSLSSRAASPQLTPPTPEANPRERRESYTHKRDTQFDEYVKRRSSGYTKLDVDRALGVEFGWEETHDTRDSLVGSGSVNTAQARARGDSLSTQQASMEASISRNSSTTTANTNSNSTVTLEAPSGMVRAHSLNSVPEAQEEDGALGLERKKTKADREALLSGTETKGISRSSSGSSRKSVRLIEQVDGLEEIELDGQRRKRNL